MTDLTEYDREIVAAAELFVDCTGGEVGATYQRLVDAVETRREAQRPRCAFLNCNKLAVQEVTLSKEEGEAMHKHHRCDEHRIEVREL